MRYLPVALIIAGCEPTTSETSPFEPVLVAPHQRGGAEQAAEPVRDPAFEFEEFEISSEELAARAPAERRAVPAEPPAPAFASPTPAPVEAAPAPAPVAPAAPVAVATGWPLRLVRTLPETQPPRAILGLPDGEEIVVKPGTMVPGRGIVVMAVGRDQVELAEITAVGDHAEVSTRTLRSQF